MQDLSKNEINSEEKNMRRTGSTGLFICAALFACFSAVVLVSASPNLATVKPLVLYDDFNGPRIDPSKWGDWMASAGMLEAVRELSPPYQGEGNNGRLRLSQRAYSSTGDDNGEDVGWIGLSFAKNPASITEVSFTVVANSAVVKECQSNPSVNSNAWAGFVGRFFNYGGQQNENQDVEAWISLIRDSTDAGAPLRATAYYTSEDGTASDSRVLGFVSPGQSAKLHLKWDQPNHQFLFQLNSNPVVSMMYAIPDTFPPTNTIKAFWQGRGIPHCTTTPAGSALMDVYVDNVYVNAN